MDYLVKEFPKSGEKLYIVYWKLCYIEIKDRNLEMCFRTEVTLPFIINIHQVIVLIETLAEL
jgi:hypothetical protein